MLRGEVFGTPDTLLPGGGGHRGIMGLCEAASKCTVTSTWYPVPRFLRRSRSLAGRNDKGLTGYWGLGTRNFRRAAKFG
jgi:hypothetical protein